MTNIRSRLSNERLGTQTPVPRIITNSWLTLQHLLIYNVYAKTGRRAHLGIPMLRSSFILCGSSLCGRSRFHLAHQTSLPQSPDRTNEVPFQGTNGFAPCLSLRPDDVQDTLLLAASSSLVSARCGRGLS